MTEKKDCFKKYKEELGLNFIGVFPTQEFKALLDISLKIRDLEKRIQKKYKFAQEEFDRWIEKQNPQIIYIAKIPIGIRSYSEYWLTFVKEKCGNIPEINKYNDLLREYENIQKLVDKKIKYCKNQKEQMYIALPTYEGDEQYDKLSKMQVLFDMIGEKYGITWEEFYIWIKDKGIKGKIRFGFMEVIPGIEMYALSFLKEQLGDVPELSVFEELASEFAITSSSLNSQDKII
jgi:hypothetical protein